MKNINIYSENTFSSQNNLPSICPRVTPNVFYLQIFYVFFFMYFQCRYSKMIIDHCNSQKSKYVCSIFACFLLTTRIEFQPFTSLHSGMINDYRIFLAHMTIYLFLRLRCSRSSYLCK